MTVQRGCECRELRELVIARIELEQVRLMLKAWHPDQEEEGENKNVRSLVLELKGISHTHNARPHYYAYNHTRT